MGLRHVRCQVVEIPEPAADAVAGSFAEPRDLLPWADPYIARLLARHRSLGALSDSLAFLADEAYRDAPAENDARPARFSRYPSPPGVQ